VLEAEVGDHAAKVGIGIVDAAHEFDDFPVVKPESGEVRNQFDVRDAADGGVVKATQGEQQRAFPRCAA
jgi:hypothetical protein